MRQNILLYKVHTVDCEEHQNYTQVWLDMDVVHEILFLRLLHQENVTVHIHLLWSHKSKVSQEQQVIYVHTAPFTGLSGTTPCKRYGGDCTLKHTGNSDKSFNVSTGCRPSC